jgi:flagellar motor protein MotB
VQQRRSAGFPWLTLAAVVGLGLGAAGIGFAGYVYFVPYRHMLIDLKRRSGELRALRTTAEASQKELDRVKVDFAEVQGARNQRLTAEGRVRTDLKLMKTELEQRLGGAGVTVTLEPHKLVAALPEDAVFDARGPVLTRQGQDAIRAVAEVIGDKAARLLVAAPMGGVPLARWVRAQFPTPGDLSAARVGNVLKALARDGAQAQNILAVVGTVAPAADADKPATLEFELEPKD